MAVISIHSDEIEDVWRSHIQRVLSDQTGVYAVNTFHLFARLFQETQRKMETLTKEACYYLSRYDRVKFLADQLSCMLDLLNYSMECPLVYADIEILVACKVLDQLRFNILQVHENYETFLEKKENASETLESLKSSVKLRSLGESILSGNIDDIKDDDVSIEIRMCWALYHLHFQFSQLFECYTKLFANLMFVTKPLEVTDLSSHVLDMKIALQQAQLELEQDYDQSEISSMLSSENLSREDAERILMEFIQNNQYTEAVHSMHNLRRLFPGDMFGVNPSDEVEGLLFLYCKSQAQKKPGVIAIISTTGNFSEVYSALIDIKVQLSKIPSELPALTVIGERREPIGCSSTITIVSKSATNDNEINFAEDSEEQISNETSSL